MDIMKRAAGRLAARLAPNFLSSYRAIGPIREEVGTLTARCTALENELIRLDRDLDESRRLNLRAADVLDIALEHISKAESPL